MSGPVAMDELASHACVLGELRDEIRAPLKTPAWKAINELDVHFETKCVVDAL